MPIRRAFVALIAAFVGIGVISVNDAAAACATSPSLSSVTGARERASNRPGLPLGASPTDMPFAATSSPQLLKIDKDEYSDIVGLWFTVFETPLGLWNKGFQQYHAGKTELSVDSSVPPVLGNVCIGVWKATGPRTFKLRHVTWNWNPDGSPAGTFLLLTTVRLAPNGRSYTGTFESDSFDTDNKVIPDYHAEGTVRGTRITVD
jgi:hypothetical protein